RRSDTNVFSSPARRRPRMSSCAAKDPRAPESRLSRGAARSAPTGYHAENQGGSSRMAGHRIFTVPFATVYPMYVQKAERKGRTKEEVDTIIAWLTGYDEAGLLDQIERRSDFETFFAQAPGMHPNRSLITGVVCGVR